MADNESPDDPCCDCPLAPDRRDFVRQATLAAFGALVYAGMPPRLAAMVRAVPVAPLRRTGSVITYPIPAQDGAQIDRGNQVILVRWTGHIYAFNLACPHQHVALRWNEHDAEFQCPKHHSKYHPDGIFISGRATRGMDRFSITRNDGNVVVDVNAMHKNDEDPAGWNAAVIDVGAG
ncbi:MAG: ubiquinol-cytochrome c reductase iron-sulfur subunit [Gemmatimonadales bacterium]